MSETNNQGNYYANQAVDYFFKYTKLEKNNAEAIGKRSYILPINNQKVVVFISPAGIGKGGVNLTTSGPAENLATREYANSNNLKFFWIAVDKVTEFLIDVKIDEESLKSLLEKKKDEYHISTRNRFEFTNILSTETVDFKTIDSEITVQFTAINKDYFTQYIEDQLKNNNQEEITPETDPTNHTNNQLDLPHQRIFFGAPGTGKSYKLNQEARKHFSDRYERVTFHPNYMYGNFVGAFKPFPKVSESQQETITYEYVPGVLIRQVIKALKDPRNNYLLIIEEINRANVAAVFGDVFQLLDRNEEGESEYFITTSRELQEFLKKEFKDPKLAESIKQNIKQKFGENFERIYLPSNLYIWATMNSADQGVMPMDTAFKRRWEFKYLGIDEAAEQNAEEFKKYEFKINETGVVNWNEFRKAINKRLSALHISEDKLIGPYFISEKILKNKKTLKEVIKRKVLMYLYEDAAKAYRASLFAEGSYATYSQICETFDKNGLKLFKDGLGDLNIKDSNDSNTEENTGNIDQNRDQEQDQEQNQAPVQE